MINELKNIQKREKLTDLEFAKKLKIHEKSWSRIKNLRSPLGLETRDRAVKMYPELFPILTKELFGDNGNGSK